MRDVVDGLWWKPFGTLINCVNSGGCIHDIDADQCKQLCDHDDFCQMGYHLEWNGKRVCVPIRTAYQWANTNPLYSLIPSTNKTRLSTDRENVRYRAFYNEKRFPSFNELPSDFFSRFIFSGMRIFFMMKDSSPPLYLTDDLHFDHYQKLSIIIKSRYSTFYDFTVRMYSEHIISFRRDDSFLELASTDDSDRVVWSRHSSDDVKSSWIFYVANDGFIDSGTPFYLQEASGKQRFLFVDETMRLIVSNQKKTVFCLTVDEMNLFNQYRKTQFQFAEDTNHDDVKPVFTQTFIDYLSQQYSSCYESFDKSSILIVPVLISVILLLLIRLLQVSRYIGSVSV